MTEEKNTPRKPLLAALLTLISPGLGHLYNAQVLKFLFVFASFNAVRLAYEHGAVVTSPSGYFTLGLSMIALGLWAIVDAIVGARRRQDFTRRGFNRWYIYLALLFVPIPLGLLADVWKVTKPFDVPSISMEPSILQGERIMVRLDHYDRNAPQRGDLAVFSDDDGRTLLKRIVGLGGEVVELRGDQLFIDGELFPEPWPHQDSRETTPSVSVEIPFGSVYVLGDNRDNSRDSRHFGVVGENQLGGRALYIAWSRDFSRLGRSLLVDGTDP